MHYSVVGAGISGLTFAHYYKDCHIYEAKAKAGGLACTENSLRYLHYSPDIANMLSEIGVGWYTTSKNIKFYDGKSFLPHPITDQALIKQYTEKSTKERIEHISLSKMSSYKYDTSHQYIVIKGGFSAIISKLLESSDIRYNTKRELSPNTIWTAPMSVLLHNLKYKSIIYAEVTLDWINIDRSVNSIYVPIPSIKSHRITIANHISNSGENIEQRILMERTLTDEERANITNPAFKRKMKDDFCQDLISMGLITHYGDIAHISTGIIPIGYIINEPKTDTAVAQKIADDKKQNIHYLGRFAEWNQDNIGQSMLKAKKLAEVLKNGNL